MEDGMKYLIIFALFLIGCEETPKYSVAKYERPMKYCMEECLHKSFKMFHNNGKSWGTGSSSMNGLKQTQIFDRVVRYCEDYYSGETCCERPSQDYKNTVVISHQHGYEYGACVKDAR